jgi:hypothetical protein
MRRVGYEHPTVVGGVPVVLRVVVSIARDVVQFQQRSIRRARRRGGRRIQARLADEHVWKQ